MTGQWIDVAAVDGGQFGAYLALPPTGSGPGLVLVQEIFGVNRHIRAVAEQYALDGFVVLVPDIFWRQHPRVELAYSGDDMARAVALKNGLKLDEADNDLGQCLATLRARPEVTGKVGIFGFCLGGRLSFRAAAKHRPDFACCYYGGGIDQDLALADRITGPIQFHYAENDGHIPLTSVAQIQAALTGKPVEFFVYSGAGHGFNCWDRGAYHRASALLAHGRTLQAMAQALA